MTSTYAKQKLWEAVHALATSDGSIQNRLADAAIYLVHLQPMEAQLAPDYRERFSTLLASLTKEPGTEEEGAIRATARKMNSKEASRVAGAILELFTDLQGGLR